MKKVGWLFIVGVVLIAGCSKIAEASGPVKGIIKENTIQPIEYVQHIEDNRYQLGIIDKETNELKWIDTDGEDLVKRNMLGLPLKLKVVVENGIDKSYLERKQDDDSGYARFVLHIKGNEKLEAGTVTKSCGKACEDKIQTKMLNK